MNILFFGGHYWNRGAWFRKQQFASRLSKRGHKVFYVEESPSIIRKKSRDKNFYFKTFYSRVNENLFIITPSARFPLPHNPYSIYLYYKKLMFEIKRILDKEKVKDYILWSNKLDISSIINNLNSTKIIDICDDLPFYYKLEGNEKFYKSSFNYLKKLLSVSDIPIVSAQKIKEKYSRLTDKEIIVIPNGHNLNPNSNINFTIPDDIIKIRKPIIGFIGTLFQFIDENLLEYIISRRPQYNFVFVGGIEDGYFPIDKLKKFSNVYLLGRKPQREINSYINSFDVCINTFKIHEVNDSVNPVKVFEYLANKKHVISTKMYSLMKEKIADYITFAQNYDEFLEKLDKSLEMDKVNNIPDELIQEYHWDNLFERLINQIKIVHNLEL